MKNSSFENNLKSLSQDFVVDVNQQQFNRVMELRAQQNKRRKMWCWFGSVSAVVIGILFFASITQYVSTNNKNSNVHQSIKTQVESPVYTQANKGKSITPNLYKNQHEDKKLNQSKLELTPNNYTKSKAIAAYNSTKQTTLKTSNKTPKKQSIPIKNSITFFGDDTANNPLKLITINKPMLVDGPLFNQALLKRQNLVLSKENKTFEKGEAVLKTKLFNGMYLEATYFPFISAKNTSGMLPDKKASMVGLSEDANFAHAANFGAVFNLSKSLQLLPGVGIHTIKFDKIREVTVSVDTMFESLTSNATKLNFEHVADYSFTWLDLPIALRYHKPMKNKLNWYVQAGLSYRYLIQNKSYTFQVDSNQLKTYELRTNHANSRINKHQITILVEPGMAYNLTRNITVNLGVPFQQELFSVYNKEYADRAAFKLLGLKAGVQYNF